MPAADTTAQRVSPGDVARVWLLHCLSFVLPVACLAYLLGGVREGWHALPWLLVLVGSVAADMWSPSEERQPAAMLPDWPFDMLLYVLAALHVVVVTLLVVRVAHHGFWTGDTFVALALVGVNSGYSAITVAHELIHRTQAHLHFLGRVLLGTVLYEHFSTEHLRGHHMRVGTSEDAATARFGESATSFLVRTVPEQFRSAWRLEWRRLGDAGMSLWDRRMLRHRVLQGVVVEWTVALMILSALGPGAFAAYLIQAAVAVRLLEAVNYFEHWGLTRRERRVTAVDSWDTASRFTLYTLVGLSRHADHHEFASRSYQQLRYLEESPKLPYGYFGTVVFLLVRNTRFREVMTAELQRCRLGPFASVDAR
ncbi:MAG TPA: fatty acid desaturase [Candidatus Binatia bacterium]|nr:fatty acid desaturase [Candidatus Binatia bacterium]